MLNKKVRAFDNDACSSLRISDVSIIKYLNYLKIYNISANIYYV